MATDTERLVLQLSADLNSFKRQMLNAAGEADRAAQRIERRFQQQNARVVRDFQGFGAQVRTILATIGVGIVARDIVAMGDAWTRVGNALASAGVDADQLAATQQLVADIALRSRADLEATADLFGRMLRSSEDLGASMDEGRTRNRDRRQGAGRRFPIGARRRHPPARPSAGRRRPRR